MMCLATSCSTGDNQAVVFTIDSGFSQGADANTGDVVDIGMPDRLHNLSGEAVTLRQITLVAVPPSVHLRYARAHSGPPGIGITDGDYLKYCRDTYPLLPLSSDVTPAHSDSIWDPVLGVTFTRPGRYQLSRVKIYYTAGGTSGWQYQYLNTEIDVVQAPKGAKPTFWGCA
jgi:hypothetical protein